MNAAECAEGHDQGREDKVQANGAWARSLWRLVSASSATTQAYTSGCSKGIPLRWKSLEVRLKCGTAKILTCYFNGGRHHDQSSSTSH